MQDLLTEIVETAWRIAAGTAALAWAGAIIGCLLVALFTPSKEPSGQDHWEP